MEHCFTTCSTGGGGATAPRDRFQLLCETLKDPSKHILQIIIIIIIIIIIVCCL